MEKINEVKKKFTVAPVITCIFSNEASTIHH